MHSTNSPQNPTFCFYIYSFAGKRIGCVAMQCLDRTRCRFAKAMGIKSQAMKEAAIASLLTEGQVVNELENMLDNQLSVLGWIDTIKDKSIWWYRSMGSFVNASAKVAKRCPDLKLLFKQDRLIAKADRGPLYW